MHVFCTHTHMSKRCKFNHFRCRCCVLWCHALSATSCFSYPSSSIFCFIFFFVFFFSLFISVAAQDNTHKNAPIWSPNEPHHYRWQTWKLASVWPSSYCCCCCVCFLMRHLQHFCQTLGYSFSMPFEVTSKGVYWVCLSFCLYFTIFSSLCTVFYVWSLFIAELDSLK